MTALPTEQPKQREHALLSASGAERWLHCPPSARLEDTLPESTSQYAEEGRLAHKLAELTVRKKFLILKPSEYKKQLKAIEESPFYASEMKEHVETYLDYISAIVHSHTSPPYLALERRLDYGHIAPEGFGTGDCIIIGGNVLHINDFKYGQGVPVEAEGNPQMLLYALGALAEYSALYDIKQVHISIIQPRRGKITEAWLTRTELEIWGDGVKPVADTAYAGEGFFAAGEWCRFCRAKAQCRARSGEMTALEAFGKHLPPLLTDAEVGDILLRARELKDWVGDLEKYALSTLLAGGDIEGWKAVEGRSNREFTDTDAAYIAAVKAGYDEALLYERRPITLTAAEKLLGKKEFEAVLGGYVIKPPGKPTLAPHTDPRAPVTNQVTPEEAFSE